MTRPIKLTRAMRNLLSEFAAGAIARVDTPGGGTWWRGQPSRRDRPNYHSLFALLSRGMVERTEREDWRWTEYRISRAGRAALAQSENSP